jgi:1-phosphatidylinositol-3-phosphate 5-kinase
LFSYGFTLLCVGVAILQEREYLRVAVARIAAHQPHVLLVEKTVARYAQDLLLYQGVSVALNVKPEVMGRVARCTGAQMVTSTHLPLTDACIGTCRSFRVEAFQTPAKVKHLMFFDGCPRPLATTVSTLVYVYFLVKCSLNIP